MKRSLFAVSILSLLFSCTPQEEQSPKIEVDSISIEQSDFTMEEGESTTLTARVLPDNADDKAIKWSSSDESKVMVSSAGKVVAMAIGKAVVTAEAGKKSDFVTITVVARTIPVTSVSLDESELTIKVGESQTLIATIKPEDASNKAISWLSSDEKIASVEDGQVTGIAPGSATITVKTEDGEKSADCLVTVKPNLAPSVTVGATNISAVSAILSGETNLESSMSSDMTMGIMISTNSGVLPSNSKKIQANDINAKQGYDASYCFSISASGLDPNVTYYFRSYVTQNGQDTYGETMAFTTKELSSMLQTQAATNISAINATANASINLSDVIYSTKSIGFYWGLSKQGLSSKISGVDGGSTFTAILSSLQPSTNYFVQGFIVLDGKEYKDSATPFATNGLESLIETREATDIKATKATLNAMLNLTNVQYGSIDYGFYWGTSENEQSNYITSNVITNNTFKATINNLTHNSQYWYKASVSIDGRVLYSDVKSFTSSVVHVESVSLNKDKHTFDTIGNTYTLTATVLPNDATDKSVRWSSDNESVATVDQNGCVKAVGNGTATITVSTNDQEKTASCDITVAQKVTSVTLTPKSLVLSEGMQYSLTVSISPENANDKSLEWSFDKSIISVDEKGTVTALSKGTTSIYATAKDGSCQQGYCSVTVIRPVSSISLNKESISLYNGESETLTATVTPSDANDTKINWSSSNPSVATVSNSGVVKGVSRGDATITATANDNSEIKATCKVEVKQYVSKITLNKSDLELTEGETFALSVTSITPDNANDKSYSWSSSDESVATIDNNGQVKAVSKGSATIYAKANDGSNVSGSCSVTVIKLISSITLEKTSVSVFVGQKDSFVVSISPEDASNRSLQFSNSNTSVAKITAYSDGSILKGIVTGLSKGEAIITVAAQDGSGVSSTCAVEVKQAVNSITLNQSSVGLIIGQVLTLTATASPDNANDRTILWTSSDNSVVSVNEHGTIEGKAKGKATITATANDGSGTSATCSIVVSSLRPNNAVDLGLTTKDGFKLYWAECNLGATKPEEYGDYYAWGETEPYYSSLDPLIFKNGKDDGYYWGSYKWANGDETHLTKYCPANSSYWAGSGAPDGKTILEPEDDAAHVLLAGNWRMPTYEECKELIEKCSWSWVYKNGVEGREATGPNGNTIFIPASGWWIGTSLYNAGFNGYFWSASIKSNDPYYSWHLIFSASYNSYNMSDDYRCYGLPIRPVSE